MGRPHRLVVAVAITILVITALGGSANADEAFDIQVPDALELPERTVTFQNETFVVNETLRTDPDSTHTIAVSAPDVDYQVNVYNSDQQIVESRQGDGPGSFTFDFEGYGPGSYALAVNYDGVFEDVFPVVVEGYSVTHDGPASAEVDGTIEVAVDVTATLADEPPADVVVIVADDQTSVRVEANRTGDTYSTSISLAELDAGTYTVWAVARDDETAFGEQTVLGMSTPGTLDVTESAETPTDSSDGQDQSATNVEDGGTGTPPEQVASPDQPVPSPSGFDVGTLITAVVALVLATLVILGLVYLYSRRSG